MLTESSNAPLILLVEDDSLHVSAIQRSFKKADTSYRLKAVGTLHDAQAEMAQQPPDLVIADFRLPDGDGTTLLHTAAGVCPVILMTAQGNEQIAVDAIKGGAHDYIIKSASAFENLPLTVKYAIASWDHSVARNNAEEAVRFAKQDWEQTFDAVPDLISIIDTNHIIIRVNQAMAERSGLTKEELIGRKCYEIMHGTTDPHSGCPHVKMLQNGDGHSVCVEEKRWDRAFDVTVSPLCDNTGQLRACVHVARDITERKRAEEEKAEYEAQFQQTQKLESLGVLAGGIAHDFNNILTIILGHCYIVNEKIGPEIDQKEHVRQIEKSAQRAADLCRQMLSYAGKNSIDHRRINLWMMVDENVKMLQSALKKSVSIELDLKYAVPEIDGDSAQIQQVIMNLIINAAEAIGDKNGTINIKLAEQIVETGNDELDFLGNPILPGSYASLTVSDTGCGMDEETQKRIFEPFFTTKFTGRGLGMSAVLGIIKSHKGSLLLCSSQGVGTTFKVYFPSSNRTISVETTQTSFPISAIKTNGAILLVDDEQSIRAIGAALLKAMGFSVMTASNGREALDIYGTHAGSIDLVLLDLLMPVMGGIDVYRILREKSPAVPIVFCSGCSIDELIEDIEDDQHAAMIQKPYNPVQLRDMLIKLIDI